MIENKNLSKNASSDSLNKILKGTSLVIIGTIINIIFFVFLSGVLIARHWTAAEVGVYTLSYSIFNICIIISGFGMATGVIRCIAHSRGKNEHEKIPDFIFTSILLCLFISCIFSIFIFVFSGFIATNIFHDTSLIIPLKIFAIAIPFFTINNKIVSIFRGFDNIIPHVYFKTIMESILFSIIILIIVLFDLPFFYIFYAYVFSGITTLTVLLLYIYRKKVPLKKFSINTFFSPASKEMLIFSVPIFFSEIIDSTIYWVGPMILGSLQNTSDVGFYFIAISFATFISFPKQALLITFLPTFSELFGRGKVSEMKSNYLFLTKWVCFFTLPVFVLFFLFSELVIQIVVGDIYLPAVNALRILSVVFIVSNITGLSGSTIIALGKSEFKMYVTLIALVLCILLTALLIPMYSILGVAVGIGVAYLFIDFIISIKIYKESGIIPISKNLIKPILLFILFIIPIYYFSQLFLATNLLSFILISVLLYIAIVVSIILTKSLDLEDKNMLLAIERKTGIKIKFLNKILDKLV